MLQYYVLVLTPIVLSVIRNISKGRYIKRETIIDSFFIIFLMLLILRDESIGADIKTYHFLFNESANYSLSEMLSISYIVENEIGYRLLSKILLYFNIPFRGMIILSSLFSIIPIWYLYRKEVNYPLVGIILFINCGVFAMYFSGLRQIMAMAYVVPAYYFAKNQKKIKFIIVVFLAYLIHKSAIIIGLIYPLYMIKNKKNANLLIIIVLFIIVYINRSQLFNLITYFLFDRYDHLLTYGVTGAYMVTVMLFLILIYSYLIPDADKVDKDFVGIRNIYTLSSFLQIFSYVNPVAMRMNYYFLPLMPILVSKTIEKSEKDLYDLTYISILLFVTFFTVYFFYAAYTKEDILKIYPYSFMFK